MTDDSTKPELRHEFVEENFNFKIEMRAWLCHVMQRDANPRNTFKNFEQLMELFNYIIIQLCDYDDVFKAFAENFSIQEMMQEIILNEKFKTRD